MADQTVRQETINLLPEYQERFLKDLLATATGIGAESPLYGTPVVDAQGNPVYELDAQGNPRLDVRGQPIPKVQGGIPRPEAMPFTPAQRRAIELGIQGIGAYAPMMEKAESTMGKGVASIESSLGRYDPRSYKEFYDPFVEEVITATGRDIAREGDIERNRVNAAAVGAGAFGGSRQAVAEQELARNVQDRQARMGAELRSAAYTGAQQQANKVFEDQMNRGLTGAQLFQGLGAAQGALGEAAQGAGMRDVNALFNLGLLEQQQMQDEYDVQRGGAIEEMYEPRERLTFLSDIFRGVPSTQSTLGVTSVPTPSRLSSIVGTAMGLGAYGQQYGGGQGIMGALTNRGGV